MRLSDLTALLPLLVVAAAAVAVTGAIAWRRRLGLVVMLSAGGLAGALASLPAAGRLAPRDVTPLLRVDGFTLVFLALVCGASLIVVLLAWQTLRTPEHQEEELYLLLLLATLGAMVLSGSTHLASLFLGIELVSVSLYALVAYPRNLEAPLEAGIKYLILAATASAVLLFGIALLYLGGGSLELSRLGGGAHAESFLAAAGFGLLLAGVGFKLAIVPFHLWAPDVYAGSPVPVAAFVSTVSKAGVFAALLRILWQVGEPGRALVLALAVMAVASMLLGNLLALLENDLKKLLAYSSIAHLGYLLIAAVAPGATAAEAAIYYLAVYLAAVLIAFGVIAILSRGAGQSADLAAFRGLFWRRPLLAALFAVSLFSLAGIPPTGGFIGKLYLLVAGVEAGQWLLVWALVAGSAIGLFYYLRVVVVMFSGDAGEAEPSVRRRVFLLVMLTLLAVGVVWLGVAPGSLGNLIHETASTAWAG